MSHLDGWPEIGHIAGHPYRVEAWRLADGGKAVVVRGLVNAPSFADDWKPVVAFVDERWGKDALIIEDWGQEGMYGRRFHIMSLPHWRRALTA